MPRLRRVDCSAPGIRRRRAGRGFTYVGADGARVTDRETLDRIRALAIPPAWDDVWICSDPNGHIQATGLDARGRRQYRYHERWRERRDAEKFDRMLAFAEALPGLRRRVAKDLALPGMPREKVLACAVRLLDLGFFRIGTEQYAEENESFGLATMRKRHVRIAGEAVVFDYPAKGGRRRVQQVADPAVREIVAELKARRGGGHELLAFRDDDGAWHDLRSADINAFIKERAGESFSAKDFRTWHATVLAAVGLAVSTRAASTTARQRAIRRTICEVATYLGNTPTVCRTSYVDPRIVDRYTAGATVAGALEAIGDRHSPGDLAVHGEVEAAVLDLLTGGRVPRVAAA